MKKIKCMIIFAMLLMVTVFSSCDAKTMSIDEAVVAIKNMKPGKSITIVLDANTTEITDELKDALSDYSYLDERVISEIENITIDYGYDASIKFLQKYVKKVNLDLSKTKLTEILEKTFGDMDRGGCINLANVTIPSSVTSIGEEAFFLCSLLANVNIPNSVISIGDKAFYDCYSLTSVTIPSSVISIGDEAFYGCSNLTISVAESNSSFSSKDGALYNKDKTILISWLSVSDSVVIPNSVIHIGDKAFYGCKSPTSVTIPDSVISIGKEAFRWCDSLTNVTIPESVISIGDEAFSGCSNLAISVAENNKYFSSKDGVLYNKDKTILIAWPSAKNSVTIPSGVTEIGNRSFYRCDSLTSVVIPDSVILIGEGAFYWCDSLTSVVIPDSVISIGKEAFHWCDSLASINIPDSVISIGKEAFLRCDSLTNVTIPESVISIGDEAFSGCSNLAISVAENNKYFSSKDGVLYNKDKTILIAWPSTRNSVIIPSGVTEIGDKAFYRCTSLTSVTIPNSVISIGEEAFSWCDSLTSVTIPNSVISIGDHAFLSCSSLKSVTIPSSVKSIGWFAFSFCSSLTSAIIPYELSSAVDKQFVFDDNVIIYTK